MHCTRREWTDTGATKLGQKRARWRTKHGCCLVAGGACLSMVHVGNHGAGEVCWMLAATVASTKEGMAAHSICDTTLWPCLCSSVRLSAECSMYMHLQSGSFEFASTRFLSTTALRQKIIIFFQRPTRGDKNRAGARGSPPSPRLAG